MEGLTRHISRRRKTLPQVSISRRVSFYREEDSSPEPEVAGDKTYRGPKLVKAEREPSPIMWFSPTPDRSPERVIHGWKHPAELELITPADWSDTKIIHFLIANSFDVPHRGNIKGGSPFVQIVRADGRVIILPVGYRIPLLFLARFQWLSLKLVLTAASKEKEWQEYKFGILHVSRLCKALFDAADEQSKFEGEGKLRGMDRKWRCPTFDRALARYRLKWFLSTPAQLQEFWETYQEEEYEKDALKFDWRRWAIKGHRGFALSDEEVTNGVTARQFIKGLKLKDEKWYWETSEDPVPGGVDAWSLRYTAMGVLSPSHDSSALPVDDPFNLPPPVSTLSSTNSSIKHSSIVAPALPSPTPDADHSIAFTSSTPSFAAPVEAQSKESFESLFERHSACPLTDTLQYPGWRHDSPTSMPTNSSVSTSTATDAVTSARTSPPAAQISIPTSEKNSAVVPVTGAPAKSSDPDTSITGVSAGATNSVMPDRTPAQSQAALTIPSTTPPATNFSTPFISPLTPQPSNSSGPHQKETKDTIATKAKITTTSSAPTSVPIVLLQSSIPRKRPGSPLEKENRSRPASGAKSLSVGKEVPTVLASTLEATQPSNPSAVDPSRALAQDTSSSGGATSVNLASEGSASNAPESPSIAVSGDTTVPTPVTLGMPGSQSATNPARAMESSSSSAQDDTSPSPTTIPMSNSTTSHSPAPSHAAASTETSHSPSSSPSVSRNGPASSLAFSNITKEEAARLMGAKVWRPLVKELKSQVGSEDLSQEENHGAPEELMDVDKGGEMASTSNDVVSALNSNNATSPLGIPATAASPIASSPAMDTSSDVASSSTNIAPFPQIPILQHPPFCGPYVSPFYLNSPNHSLRSYGVVPYHAAAGAAHTKSSSLASLPLQALHQLAHKAGLQLAKTSSTRSSSADFRSDTNGATPSENPSPSEIPSSVPPSATLPDAPTSTPDESLPVDQAQPAVASVPPEGVVKIIDSLFTGFAEALRKFSVELRQLKEEAVKEMKEEMMEIAREGVREVIREELAELSSTVLGPEVRFAVREELQEGPLKSDLREGNQADVKDGVRVVVATMREEVLREMRESFRDVRGEIGRIREEERELARDFDGIRGYLKHEVRRLEEVVKEEMQRSMEVKGVREVLRTGKAKAFDPRYARHPLQHLIGFPDPEPALDAEVEMSDSQIDIIPKRTLSAFPDVGEEVVHSQPEAGHDDLDDREQIASATYSEDVLTRTSTRQPSVDNDFHQSHALPFYMENPSPMPVKSQRKFQKMALSGRGYTSGANTEDEAIPAPEVR